ncbi:hypothetical protein TICRE_21100 [Tissierella creatinophila DSM 6911]|uniref:Uncharacterized protein n=2 Tax=Tissierella creatinophila TaxID=79681 RepID=A0A1U7M443_TISCR|nr:hypothetical protein TICRE_21100 [Tissierella creatinophila DSM 6911]
MKIMTVGDKFLIVVIIILSITSIFYITRTTTDSLGKDVIVRFDGIEIAKIPLKTDKQSTIYDFKFGENIGELEIFGDRVRMLPMDIKICPERICSDTGWIENSYQMIVCLPNKVIVTIETNEKQDIDIIVRN